MTDVLRWGRAAYETDADLALERAGTEALGLGWSLWTGPGAPDLRGCKVLVVHSGTRLGPAEIAAFGGELILTTTSGHDHIDLAAARAAGVTVARSPLARRDAVVEHALGGMIGLGRRLDALHALGREGVWARAALPGLAPRGIAGAKVVVVGCGVIGSKMADVLDALGAVVVEVDPWAPPGKRTRFDLDEALVDADFVTLHCALSERSVRLFDEARLSRLKPTAILVNTARGDVLDVDAAVARVVDGRLGGLLVDVFPTEPWPKMAAMNHDRVWFTPHASGYTMGLGARVAEAVITAVTAWSRGAPVPWRVV